MVAVITSVLAGSTAGLLAAVSSNQSLLIGLVAGGIVGAAALVAMMRYQRSAWQEAAATPFSASDEL
jgi:ABC-type thiamin/hydroxymethylpyrimidine transport system permease subunit